MAYGKVLRFLFYSRCLYLPLFPFHTDQPIVLMYAVPSKPPIRNANDVFIGCI